MNLDGKFTTHSHGKMEDVSINSVYNLITKLCEKLLSSQKNNISKKLIKKYRSKAYEILLSKKIFEQVNAIILEDNNDPYCYLLAWQFVLIEQHNLPEHAQKLQRCISALMKSSSLNEKVLSDVLYVLFKLCKLPEQNDVISINNSTLHTLENIMKFRYFDSTKFKLSVPMICSESKFSNESFLLKTKQNVRTYKYLRTGYSETDICKECHIPLRISCSSSEYVIKADGDCKSPAEEEGFDIWDLVSKTEFTDHRTWETLGNSHPSKEPPFLSEAPSNVCSNLYKMHASNIIQFIAENNNNIKLSITTEQKSFISDVKNLLVGIASNSFKRDSDGLMYLVPGTTIEGITVLAMNFYCKDLLLCTTCYTALDNLCNFYSATEECHRQGFIFKELCDSINRYLAYYRLAIQNISETTNLLSVHSYIKPLLSHLTVLASVCRVGPFKVPQSYLPDGVLLINYLYQQTTEVTEKHVIMVLYSILYPCIQIYFNRFIQQWIFEGMINDPYSEFFIGHDPSYSRARGRTYWTRCHKIKLELIPDFLDDITQDILTCGKALNLLKLCVPNSPLCMYLMGKKPNLLSCCLSSEQIHALERNSVCYYLEVMAECGPRFQVDNFISRNFEQNMIFMDLITKKRAATLKRLELEKLKHVEEEVEKKRNAMAKLKKQYDEALQNKKLQLISEIETEMRSNEEILKMQNLRQKLIAEETLDLIEYYDKLNCILDKRQNNIQNHIEKLKKIDLDSSNLSSHESSNDNISNASVLSTDEDEKTPILQKSDDEKSPTSSNETFISAKSQSVNSEEEFDVIQQIDEHATKTEIHSSTSLDIINANAEGDTKISEVARMAAENFEIARRNRAKVLTEEMGMAQIEIKPTQNAKTSCINESLILTDLERNRLKVMSSEFGLRISPKKIPLKREMSCCEINKRKNMASNECFRNSQDDEQIDKIENKRNMNTATLVDDTTSGSKTNLMSSFCNDNYLNINVNLEDNGNDGYVDTIRKEENGNGNVEERIKEKIKVEEKNLLNKSMNDNTKSNNLKLDFSKLTNMQQTTPKITESIFSRFLKSPNFELDKPIPMSLGSTPCIDSVTCRMQSSVDKELFENLESGATTATTNFTDDGFNFRDIKATKEPLLFTQKHQSNSKILEKTPISKRVSIRDAANISTRSIRVFIEQSVSIPLTAHLKLVNNELLKYFFIDLQLLTHLNSLRNYFFLLDGEFGRNITEGLFEKLYDVNFPIDLINCRTLKHLVYSAIDSSIKQQENSNCLSFKINSLPKTFNLEDPDVLECLSLTYKVDWPLNILLPSDTIAKYDDVFKFLLKLNRISWVLKKILQDLKLFSKKSGKREAFLVLSVQFQKLHHHRHIMTHFVQAVQNYVVGEVLQTSRAAFERKLMTVSNIDEIYSLHVTYIKNILFKCLLNQRSVPIQKLILKIFTVILKFYNYLRMAEWVFDEEECVYEHPNFKKLEDIFQNFEDLAAYFVKAADKVAKVGYQPNLSQLLDMLNVNDYYLKKIGSRSSSNTSTLGSSNFESASHTSL